MYGDRHFNVPNDITAKFSFSFLKNSAKKVYMYELEYRGEYSELDKFFGIGLVPIGYGSNCKCLIRNLKILYLYKDIWY